MRNWSLSSSKITSLVLKPNNRDSFKSVRNRMLYWTTCVQNSSVFWDITPWTDVLEKHVTSIFRVEEANQVISKKQIVCRACWILAWLLLWHWRWKRHFLQKRKFIFNWIHLVISKNTELSITTSVRTSIHTNMSSPQPHIPLVLGLSHYCPNKPEFPQMYLSLSIYVTCVIIIVIDIILRQN
jgi:hypothetical protein